MPTGLHTLLLHDALPICKCESAKCPLTQVRNRGFWGCRRKSAETPVFMRVGRRFCPQLEPHLGFVSKNGSYLGCGDMQTIVTSLLGRVEIKSLAEISAKC